MSKEERTDNGQKRKPELPNLARDDKKSMFQGKERRNKFQEIIDKSDYGEIYSLLSTEKDDVEKFFSTIAEVVERCEDEVMRVEFIHLGMDTLHDVASVLGRKELHAVVKFFQASGNAYWEMQVFESALKIFEDAIYFLQSLDKKSEDILLLLFKVINYREEIRQFHLASRDSMLGFTLALEQGKIGWVEAFSTHVQRNNLETIKIYALSAQSLIWDGVEKLAKNNIIRAITAISDIFKTERVPDTLRDLLKLVADIFSSIRQLSEEDNTTIELLLKLRNSSKLKESALQIHNVLSQYCNLAYQPRLYVLLICSTSGQLVYSLHFDENAVQGSEELYSGLFTALSFAMSDALGKGHQSYSVEYGGRQVIMERGESFLAYLICERETPELHSKLQKILNEAEEDYASMNPYTVASGKAMRILFEPKVDEEFAEYRS